jgi:hypothetical protein
VAAYASFSQVVASEASTPPSGYKIIIQGGSAGSAIHKWLLCALNTSCGDQALLQRTANSQIKTLNGELFTVATTHFSHKFQPLAKKFALDVTLVYSAWEMLPKAHALADQVGTLGFISFGSNNLISDAYLLKVVESGAHVSFKKWAIGPLTTVQVVDGYSRFIAAHSTNVDAAIAMDEYTLEGARYLKSEASGPSKAFNALILMYANAEIKINDLLLPYLKGKANSPNSSLVNSESRAIAVLDQKIATLASRLSLS